ncbi:hypothetical protein KQI74_22115 [Paenibacillus barcinonensis]|uniref:hypothetical protein n=1 Tax=Paenibacillus barcinonensis TaxID=198119 RepID=UPI001C0FE021|nr:hypothetical protein [Paenibacillus barcinonensis]MBU5354983.1 hypothetical protein [Paenibacillus barcinonensis]
MNSNTEKGLNLAKRDYTAKQFAWSRVLSGECELHTIQPPRTVRITRGVIKRSVR